MLFFTRLDFCPVGNMSRLKSPKFWIPLVLVLAAGALASLGHAELVEDFCAEWAE